jgi:hypothetical protein
MVTLFGLALNRLRNPGDTPRALLALLLLADPSVLTLQKLVELL